MVIASARWVLMVLLGLSASGCATVARIEPVRGDGQSLDYVRGVGVLESRGERTSAIVVPTASEYVVAPRMSFRVYVANDAAPTFDVSEADILASANGQALHVVPAEQLVQDVRNEIAAEAIVTAIAGAANYREASGSGYTSHAAVSSTTTYTSLGPVNAQTTTVGLSYDPDRRREAQRYERARTDYALSALQASRDAQLDAIATQALQRTTLRPGQFTEGFVVVEVPPRRTANSELVVVVRAAGESHRFLFVEHANGGG